MVTRSGILKRCGRHWHIPYSLRQVVLLLHDCHPPCQRTNAQKGCPCALRCSSSSVTCVLKHGVVVLTGGLKGAEPEALLGSVMPVFLDLPPAPLCLSLRSGGLNAKWRSVCIALLFLLRDLCLKLGAVVLTGDCNKGAEREDLSGDSGDRRISSLEAVFSYACVPWSTSGVTPLWRSGGEPHGQVWPECCGFVIFSSRRSSGSLCGTARPMSNTPPLA